MSLVVIVVVVVLCSGSSSRSTRHSRESQQEGATSGTEQEGADPEDRKRSATAVLIGAGVQASVAAYALITDCEVLELGGTSAEKVHAQHAACDKESAERIRTCRLAAVGQKVRMHGHGYRCKQVLKGAH